MPKRHPLGDQARDDKHLSEQVLERGNDHIVSFTGTSQFTAQGISACGIAAFNFARIAFRIEQHKKNLADVLAELSTREIIEEIVAICAGWSDDMHLEVDDIHNLPIFSRALKLESIEYCRPRPKHFQTLLENMKKIEKSAVMIITRPPEIIACFKFATSNPSPNSRARTPDNPVFVIFDSHPRPSHPQGAGLSFSTSVESTARTLSDILPTMDETLFDSSDLQWQAQLLANCSAHVFVGRRRRKDHEAAVIQSSLAILELRARISELKCENKKLESDNKQLESEADGIRTSMRQEQAKAKHKTFTPPTRFKNRSSGFSFGLFSHAVAGPSRSSGSFRRSVNAPTTNPVKHVRPAHAPAISSTSGAQSIFAHNPPPVPSQLFHPGYEESDLEDGSSTDSDDLWTQSASLARQLQDEFDSEDWQLRQEHARLAHRLQDGFDSESRRPGQKHTRVVRRSQNKFDSEDRSHRQDHARQLQNKVDSDDRGFHQGHMRLARQLQDKFDDEDRQLRREQAELSRHVQATFQCSICLDELPEDDVAKVDACVHTMCRSCLREFVSSKIQEHRYPIFCPMCTIDEGIKTQPGTITRLLIEQLGVSEEQSQILTEMELAEFTIQVHCRRCQRPSFVDREDYSEVFNIVCPQSDCNHVWCKKCEQTIIIDGPKHSCDGSSELDHLMKEKGWKHCPNCTTPILKETGCNHMTCISPGCNTHFCYVCGDMIVRSALNHEINEAVSAHFSKCQLFEVPN